MSQHSRRSLRLAFGAALSVAALSLAACAGTPSADPSTSSSSSTAPEETVSINSLNVIAPADPGGGWDQTARSVAQAISGAGIVSSAPVTNIGGAGGTIGLAALATETDPYTLMITGSVMVGAVETNDSAVRIEDMTPMARLTEEPLIIVVPESSPYQTIGEFVAAWVEQGAAMPITGGSAGGIDHILAGLLLTNAGVAAADIPSTLNYIANSGGGEALTLLLGNQVAAGISGVGEFSEQVKAGKLRALAVSSSTPAALLPEVPTLTDEGIDVVLTNWRGLIAPGGISDADADALRGVLQRMYDDSDWTDIVASNGWTDAFLVGPDFDAFLASDIVTTQDTLRTIGLIE